MKTIAEQIRDLENTRAAKAARMQAVLQKSIDEGRSTDEAEAEEFDGIELEIKQLDEDLVRLNKMNTLNSQSAKPLQPEAGKSIAGANASRGGPTIIIAPKDAPEKFEGQTFVRSVIAKAEARRLSMNPVDYAHNRWGKTNPSLVEWMKTDVAGLGATVTMPGSELSLPDTTFMGDFIEYLNSKTLYNQLPLREVPANIYIKGQDGAATGYWVGEGKSIPMSKPDFSAVTLTPLKVGALSVITNELLRDSSPSAEKLVRDALVEAIAQRIDTTFISTTAAVNLVSPAGILNNIAGSTSAGTDNTGLLNDIKELRYDFISAKNSGGLVWVMNPALASSIGLMRNALGQKEFTEINESGGMLEGNKVYVSDNVNANYLVLLKPSDIYRIGNGPIEVSISEHATIEMATNPSGDSVTPTDQSQGIVGMFQAESTAIKVVQSINFARRRTSAVSWIKDADYGGAIST
jgi:HK97 family phage major capsid protein